MHYATRIRVANAPEYNIVYILIYPPLQSVNLEKKERGAEAAASTTAAAPLKGTFGTAL